MKGDANLEIISVDFTHLFTHLFTKFAFSLD